MFLVAFFLAKTRVATGKAEKGPPAAVCTGLGNQLLQLKLGQVGIPSQPPHQGTSVVHVVHGFSMQLGASLT